jgi:hypothetical protein
MPLIVPQHDAIPIGLIPERLSVERVLYEAEVPVLFLTRTLQGQLLLAYVAEENSAGTFTVLAPISAKTLISLEVGATSVRDALTATCGWLHLNNGSKTGTWSIDFDQFPKEYLPLPGTPLLPEHEPVLRTRAVGEKIVLGQMPASVVSFVADATKKAIKTLLDFVLANPSEGRPREEHRALYDLPVQSFSFASFELSFGPPDEGIFPLEQIQQAAKKLQRGLAWASSDSRDALEADSDEEREAILRATLFLTPPSAGPIREMQVSGTWIPSQKVVLTRQSRKRIRKELKQVDSEQIVKYEGRIGEVDVDNLSFILRDISDGIDRRGLFAEDLVEEMIVLLSDSERVAVAGFERQGRLNITAVAPIRTTSTEA